MAALSLYNERLGSDKIRLLTLIPGQESEQIRCTLAVHPIDEFPVYEALSYVWGVPDPNKRPPKIICNGQRTEVGQNLCDALKTLRLGDRSRVFWIDAICVNQGDNNEKSHQVQRMRSIYAQAERVVIWLGKADDVVAKTAVQLFRKISTICRAETGLELPDIGQISRNWPLDEELSVNNLPNTESSDWKYLFDVLRREWFHRVWVIQEASVAYSVTIQISEHTCDWVDLGLTDTWLMGKGAFEHLGVLDYHFQAYGIWTQSIRFGAKRWPLMHLLSIFRAFAATDPHDRVYALLGISAEGTDLELTQTPSILTPNYDLPVTDFYSDVVRFLIEHPYPGGNPNLDILTLVYHYPDVREDGFPSWVPRWDTPETRINFGDQPQFVDHNASKDLAAKLIEGSANESLMLRGLFVDTVEQVDKSLFNLGANSPEMWLAVVQLWTEIVLPKFEALDLNVVSLAFAIVVTAGSSSTDRLDGQPFNGADFGAYCRDCLQRVTTAMAEAGISRQEQTEVEKWFPMPQSVESAHGPGDLFGAAIETTRPFFTTDKGRMGLGPVIVEEGDRICVLFGGKMPFVLRPTGEYYRLVGECFVPGLLHGEAIDKWQNGLLEEQVFELR
jgi:hypothetical protein